MQPGEICGADDSGVVDELGNRELRFRVVAACGKVREVGLPNRVKQKIAGDRHSPTEDEELRIQDRAQSSAGLPEPSAQLSEGLQRNGVETEFYDPQIGAGIARLLRDNTRLVYCESPGSLTFEMQDIPAIAAAAHARGIVVLADNTWATPYFFRPFEKGIDVSIIYPGYIMSEMNEKVAQQGTFMVDTKTGVKSMVDAIEKRKQKAYVPAWPWVPIGFVLKHAPMSVVRKLA